MKLLGIGDFARLDGRKLMDVYAESNEENIDYFYPDTTDRAAALAKIEEDFLAYVRDDVLSKEQNRYMVLEREGEWVSALRLYELEAGEYYIEALETRPDRRRQGFGAALLGLVLERLKETGPFRVRDCVNKKNTASQLTHKKCGFTVADDVGHDLLDGSADERSYSMEYRYNKGETT